MKKVKKTRSSEALHETLSSLIEKILGAGVDLNELMKRAYRYHLYGDPSAEHVPASVDRSARKAARCFRKRKTFCDFTGQALLKFTNHRLHEQLIPPRLAVAA